MKRLVLGLTLLSMPASLQAQAVQPTEDRSAGHGPQGQPGPLSPIGQLQGLITADDYPAEAIREHEEGSVLVAITVDDRGSVADCVVKTSSGSAALDAQTCRLIWLRARFQPARDSSGKPTTGVFQQRITWRLEGGMPTTAWARQILVTLGSDGELKSCLASVQGAMTYEKPADCSAEFEDFGRAPFLSELVKAETTLILEERFVPGEVRSDDLQAAEGDTLLTRVIFDLEIDETGKVVSCREKASEGPLPTPHSCKTAVQPFDAPRDPSGQATRLKGSVVFTAYLRPKR